MGDSSEAQIPSCSASPAGAQVALAVARVEAGSSLAGLEGWPLLPFRHHDRGALANLRIPRGPVPGGGSNLPSSHRC